MSAGCLAEIHSRFSQNVFVSILRQSGKAVMVHILSVEVVSSDCRYACELNTSRLM